MRKIIIATHHRLAEGMKDTVKYVLPDTADIIAISAYLTNKPIDEEILSVFADVNFQEDEVIVFTDMLGGSVNQAFARYLNNDNLHIITGVNLPVIMSILFDLNEGFINRDAIREAVNEAREQLIYVNDFVATAPANDEGDE
ncbi:PTS N-acetylglucosamine transporter subunit IIBC [Gibbsiella greigii]